jgi:hypothetical protein
MEMISFTTLPLYPGGEGPQYRLYRMMDGPQSQSGRCGIEKNLLPLLGIEPQQFSL